MEAVGIGLLASGVFLGFCAYKGVNPVDYAKAVLTGAPRPAAGSILGAGPGLSPAQQAQNDSNAHNSYLNSPSGEGQTGANITEQPGQGQPNVNVNPDTAGAIGTIEGNPS